MTLSSSHSSHLYSIHLPTYLERWACYVYWNKRDNCEETRLQVAGGYLIIYPFVVVTKGRAVLWRSLLSRLNDCAKTEWKDWKYVFKLILSRPEIYCFYPENLHRDFQIIQVIVFQSMKTFCWTSAPCHRITFFLYFFTERLVNAIELQCDLL